MPLLWQAVSDGVELASGVVAQAPVPAGGHRGTTRVPGTGEARACPVAAYLALDLHVSEPRIALRQHRAAVSDPSLTRANVICYRTSIGRGRRQLPVVAAAMQGADASLAGAMLLALQPSLLPDPRPGGKWITATVRP